jgi:hypothetical protein
MKKIFFPAVAFVIITSSAFVYKYSGPSPDGTCPSCSYNGIKLQGKVQVVEAFPDIKVQIVDAFPDIKVQEVTAFPDQCGKWQFVDAFPDFKIQFVDAFPDVKIQYVDAFPGCP